MKNKIKNFLEQKISHIIVVTFLFFIIIPSTIFGFWYNHNKINELSSQIIALSNNINQIDSKLASTTVEINSNIDQTQISLKKALVQEKQNFESKLLNVRAEVGSVSGAVNTLEKLSKTDPELLQKYSKVFFLNEHYAPPRLVEVPSQYKYSEKRDYQFYDKAWPYLEKMLNMAKADNIDLYIYSAYRSFDTQGALKGQYSVTYGSGTANQFSADQGYSEHQLGTTVDLITTGIGGELSGFEKTEAYIWLTTNAYKFGFTLSYPKNNSYYVFEPWHWRFVGVKLATYLKRNNKFFYELTQREIDKYLILIFD